MERETFNSKGESTGTVRVLNSEHINRSRVRIDTRKWLLSKLAPKKYGEKLDLNVGGQDGKPIPVAQVITNDPLEAARIYQRVMKGEPDKDK